jgi:hypothetical protein
MLTKTGQIRHDDKCLMYGGGNSIAVKDKLMLTFCHENPSQKWSYHEETAKISDEHQLIHSSGYCLEMLDDKHNLIMNKCDNSNPRQIWKWKKRNDS